MVVALAPFVKKAVDSLKLLKLVRVGWRPSFYGPILRGARQPDQSLRCIAYAVASIEESMIAGALQSKRFRSGLAFAHHGLHEDGRYFNGIDCLW